MKVQIGIFECTGIMGQDLVHPYIQSTTVLCDMYLSTESVSWYVHTTVRKLCCSVCVCEREREREREREHVYELNMQVESVSVSD